MKVIKVSDELHHRLKKTALDHYLTMQDFVDFFLTEKCNELDDKKKVSPTPSGR